MTEEQSDSTRTAEEEDQQGDASTGRSSEADQEEKAAEREADTSDSSDSDDSDDEKSDFEKETEQAKEEVQQLEEDPPDKLEDWPTGKAKYETFGGPEGRHGYHEGPEAKLGPDSVRHREDGSVEVAGEEADEPEEFKGEPVPGGPTDPATPNTRMDKASPDDVSDVAQRASGQDDESGEGESRDDESGDDEG